MRQINKIIVHCSYTPPSMDIGVETIRDWHVNERGWDDVGYAYVIRRDGKIEKGRSEETIGAHTYGHNHDSIGVCLVGGMREQDDGPDSNYTFNQYQSLYRLLRELQNTYPDAEIFGHRDFSEKTCPNFDAPRFL